MALKTVFVQILEDGNNDRTTGDLKRMFVSVLGKILRFLMKAFCLRNETEARSSGSQHLTMEETSSTTHKKSRLETGKHLDDNHGIEKTVV